MDGQTADGAGVRDPRTVAADSELLSALMVERYGRPMWPPAVTTLHEHRRRILLGEEDERYG